MKWLIDMSIYCSVTAVIILLIKAIFKNKMSAKWHYYIWGILLVRILIPTLPESNISIFNQVPTINNVEVRQLPAYEISAPAQNYIIGNVAISNTKVPFTVEKLFADYIFYAWVIAAILLFFYFVFIYISFSKSVKSMKVCDNNIFNLLKTCKNRLGIKADIKVVIGGNTPMLKGMLNPVILLPEGYSETETKNIFIHELCHFKYKDVLALWIAAVILCINWFNPIIWYSFFVLRKDIELACDQRVLEIAEDKKEYAGLLLKTALRRNRFMLGTTSMQNGEKEVSKRIKYIAYFKKPKVYWSIIILLIGLIVGGICLTNAVQDKKASNPKNKEQTLLQYKTRYVGDNSKVGNILSNLTVPKGVSSNGMELKTKKQPYGIVINYNVTDNSEIISGEKLDTLQFYKNSAVIFSLVENVDNIFVRLENKGITYQLKYTRQMVNQSFKADVRNFSKDEGAFKEFLTKVENLKLDDSLLKFNG